MGKGVPEKLRPWTAMLHQCKLAASESCRDTEQVAEPTVMAAFHLRKVIPSI
jgi:hypothetical protein